MLLPFRHKESPVSITGISAFTSPYQSAPKTQSPLIFAKCSLRVISCQILICQLWIT
ncbi:MAG: hypothetical protein G01um101470_1054, partial [Parcubacteria group bacterium Gr01-1014_70]